MWRRSFNLRYVVGDAGNVLDHRPHPTAMLLRLLCEHCPQRGRCVLSDFLLSTSSASSGHRVNKRPDLLSVVGALLTRSRSDGVEGGAKRVRRPSTWEVLCRLLARMSNQRRSVAGTELTAVIAALYPERSFPAVHRKLAEDPLERGRSANAARMLSSPKHTPLRVRLCPGCPDEPEDPLDGEVRS